MSWTYSGSPGTDTKDRVRFLIGDTDSADQLVTDEEVIWAASQFSNVYTVAAFLCDTLASERAGDGRKKIGDLEISAARSAAAYTSKARTFRRLAALSATPFAGGLSIAGAETFTTDSDLPQPSFTVGQHDNPEVGGQPGSLIHGTTST